MLIENEDETLSELETVEKQQEQVKSEVAASEIPDKYRNKSLDDVIKMHQEAEKMIGRQAQEVGEIRKLADELVKNNLKTNTQNTQVEPEVDFFENPQQAIQKTVSSHPDVLAARAAAQELRKMQTQQKIATSHPDYTEIIKDPGFAEWIKGSPVRVELYTKADSGYDFAAANELLSTYKELKSIKSKQAEDAGEATRKQNLKAASVDVGGTGEASKKIYRRADLIRLKMTDPQRYEMLADEIMQAYNEDRVR
jgi:hypothetical protein